MKIETLKDNRKKKGIIIAIVFVVMVVGVATLTTSLAKFQKTQSIPIVRGKISYQLHDLDIVAVKLEQENGSYADSVDIPTSGYTLNSEKSICKVGEEQQDVTIEYVDNKININRLSKKGTKCYLYFDKIKSITIQELIAQHTIAARTDFTTTLETNTTGTLYTAEDDDGTSYYYAGAVDNNWVKFGQENGKDIYWRIIRINGNGSTRMIYAGTDPNVTTGVGTQISNDGGTTTTYAFNPGNSNKIYVGFMYTSGQAHGLRTSSNAKQQLDTWYTNNLKTNYGKYLDGNAGFCGDRTSSTSSTSAPNNTGGTGTTVTYYGAYYRLKTNKTPTYKCNYKDSNGIQQDLYTTSSANKGNKALTNPIGLITADEVAFAGGVSGSRNSSYYLYTNQNYWTMSPSKYDSTGPGMFLVESIGDFVSNRTNAPSYSIAVKLRPVINLSSDISIKGTGTATDPYVVSS